MSICRKCYSGKGITERSGRLGMDDMNEVCESWGPEEIGKKGDGAYGKGSGDFECDNSMGER